MGEVPQDIRPADLALADHHGVDVFQGFGGHGRDMKAAQDDRDPDRAEAVGQLIGLLDLRRVGGDGGDVAFGQLTKLADIQDLVIADLDRLGGHPSQRQQREAGQ